MQQPEPAPERRGYPWWGWLIGIWCLVPVFPMLIGATFPRTRRYLGVPGIILFSLCIVIVIGVAAALAGGDDSAVDSPQGTSSAPAVAVPTDTPKPTPTVTVECPTPSERAYFTRLVEVIHPAETAYSEFGRLNLEASDNVLLFLDDAWKLEVVVQLALIQSVADGIRELTAPPSLASIHRHNLQIASAMQDGNDLYAKGIDNLDADLLVAASLRINDFTTLTNEGAAKIQAHCQ